MLTILGLLLVAQIALMSLRRSYCKCTESRSRCSRNIPCEREVQMFSATKCHQPSRIAVKRTSVQHVFVQSRGRSLRAVAVATGRWSSSTVTSLSFWGRSVFVVLSQSLTPASSSRASYLVSGEPWSTVRKEQRAFVRIQCLFRSDWSLRWLDVCICTGASEKGFAFAVLEGCRELASEVGRVSERTRFKRSSRSVVPGRVRSVPFHQVSVRNVQVRTRMRCRLPEGRVAWTALRFRYNLDPMEWTSAAYGAFFRDKNITVLEARSIFNAVPHAEGN